MSRWTLLPVLLCCLAGHAAEAPDPRLEKQLTAAGFEFELDADNDYHVSVEVGGDRTQTVFLISETNSLGALEIRELWSVSYAYGDGPIPAAVMDRLARASRDLVLGAWEVEAHEDQRAAVLVFKIPAEVSAEILKDCVTVIANHADELEAELSEVDEF